MRSIFRYIATSVWPALLYTQDVALTLSLLVRCVILRHVLNCDSFFESQFLPFSGTILICDSMHPEKIGQINVFIVW